MSSVLTHSFPAEFGLARSSLVSILHLLPTHIYPLWISPQALSTSNYCHHHTMLDSISIKTASMSLITRHLINCYFSTSFCASCRSLTFNSWRLISFSITKESSSFFLYSTAVPYAPWQQNRTNRRINDTRLNEIYLCTRVNYVSMHHWLL